jgi:hypothetical protein
MFCSKLNAFLVSDDMDTRGTRATADVVLNSLYHPHTYRSPARVGKMTRECVLPSAHRR